MSTQIPTSFVKMYEAAVQHLVQQKESRTRNAVTIRSGLVGESVFIDQIGKASTSVKTGRHEPIVFSDTPHARRRLTSTFRDTAAALDSDDKLKVFLANPTGEYAVAQSRALGRDLDSLVIDAASGTAFTGVDGATAVVLPASQKVAVNYVEAGAAANTNLTLGKMRRTASILGSNEVDLDGRFGLINSSMLHSLLFDNKLASHDFNALQPLVSGQVVRFMGFTLIPSERLLGTNTSRKAIFWQRDGLSLGIWKDITTMIDTRVDLRARPMQVYTCFMMGATRMQEEQVVEVACDETAGLVTT